LASQFSPNKAKLNFSVFYILQKFFFIFAIPFHKFQSKKKIFSLNSSQNFYSIFLKESTSKMKELSFSV